MGKIKANLAGFLLFVLVASGSFLTCEIGLGSSVDTKPPTVSIEYPPVDSIIKNTFTMRGKASDETSLKEVSVTFVNTGNTGAVFGPYSAEMDVENKTWTLSANRVSGTAPSLLFEIPDGSYEVRVVATDSASRTSTASTTYKIDNTAPVLVVQRPGTIGPLTNPAEVYGAELKVTGLVADGNAVKQMLLTVYDQDGNAIAYPKDLGRIYNIAPSIDLTLARFSTTEPGTANLFSAIYGNSKISGTKNYYSTITVSDEAREYEPPASAASADASLGNTTDGYFIYDDIYTGILDTYTMKELQAMYNGSYGDKTIAAAVIAHLATHKISTLAVTPNSGTFSLNPENSPTYSVIGYDPLSASNLITAETNKLANQSTISVKISAGRDLQPLLPASFKIYLDPCDIDGTPLGGTGDDIALPRTGDGVLADKLSKSGSDYVAALQIGTVPVVRYRLVVEGSDMEGNPVAESRYGFQIKSNNTPPRVLVTNTPYDTASSGVTNADIVFTGTITADVVLHPTAPLTVKRRKNGVDLAPIAVTPTGTDWTWTFPVDEATHADDGTWELTFEAQDNEFLTGSVTRTITVDTVAPVISYNIIPTVTVTVTGTDYYNGDVDLKAAISDDNTLASVYWQVGSTASPSYTLSGTSIAGTGWNLYDGANKNAWQVLAFDTTALTTGSGTYYLSLVAVDRFGNAIQSDFTLNVDQTTDKPVVDFVNLTEGAGHLSNNLGSNLVLNGAITDDDGVDKDKVLIGIAFDVDKNGTPDSAFVYPQVSGKPGTNGKSVTFSDNLGSTGRNLAEGYYVMQILSGDIDSAATFAVSNNWTASTVERFVIDKAPPVVSIDQGQNLYAGASLTLSGTASDGAGTGISGTGIGYGVIKVNGIDVSIAADHTWTVSVDTTTFPDGNNSIPLVCADLTGQTTNTSFAFKKDTTDPTVGVTTDLSDWKTSATISLTGPCVDAFSGIQSVEYSLDSTDGSDGTWTALTVAGISWTGYITFPESAANSLYIRATDNAGNVSVIDTDVAVGIQPYIVKVDWTPPTLTETVVSAVATPKAYNGDAVFKGTFADGLSGTGTLTLKYKKNGSASWTDAAGFTAAAFSGAGYSFDVDASSHAEDGSYEFMLEAADVAGNTSSINYSLTIETVKPVVTSNMVPSDSASGKYNGTVPVKASITDDNSISSLYWQISSLPTAPTFVEATVKANGDESANGWTQVATSLNTLNTVWDSSVAGTAGDEARYLWILTCDRFGNISIGDNAVTPAANTVLVVNQDSDIPVVTFTNYDPAAAPPYVGELTLKGTVADDDGVVTGITATLGGTAVTVTAGSGSFTLPLTSQGTKALVMSVTDKNGKTFTFDATTKLKVTSGATVIQPAVEMSVVVDTEDPDLTINTAQNQWQGANFTISGSATDEFWTGVKTVVISGTGIDSDAGEAGDQPISANVTSGSWSATIPTAGLTEGSGKSLLLVATDDNGRTRSVMFGYNFDITPPVTSLLTINGGGPLTFADWKGTSSLSVTGTVSDGTGSGPSLAEYSLDGTNYFAFSGAASWSGNIPVIDGSNTIYLRSKDVAGYYSLVTMQIVSVDLTTPEVSVTTPATLVRVNGLSPLEAVFSAGDGTGSGIASIKLKIGSTVFTTPDATSDYLSGSLTSGSTYTILSVGDTTFTDKGSTSDAVGTEFTASTSVMLGTSRALLIPATYTATLSAATLLALTDGLQSTVYVQATDGVGKTSTASFTVLSDETPPTADFTSPAEMSTVNKTISISGTAGDTQALASVLVEIQKGAGYEPLGTFSGTAGYNWTISNFNTVTYGVAEYDTNGATAGILLNLRATATDAAGNVTSVTRSFYVDQDSDRPTVKLSNVNINGTTILKMTGTIFGTVSDDDGAVTLFEVSEDGTFSTDASDDVTLDGNTWSRDASSGDGAKRLYFRVKDAAGTVFTTEATTAALLDEPKVQYGASFGNTYVDYRVDTVTPELSSNILVDRVAPFDFSADANTGILVNNMPFGGTSAQFAVSAVVTDANGISGVSVAIPGVTGSPFAATASFTNAPTVTASAIKKGGLYKISVAGTPAFTDFGAANNVVGTEFTSTRDGTGTDTGSVLIKSYNTGSINIGAIATVGYVAVTIEATDTSGLKSTATRTILIDNAPPSVTHQSPVLGSTVNGEIEVKGLTDDGLGSGIKSVQYKIGKNSDPASETGWTAVTAGTLAWKIDFKGANKIDTYATSVYGTDDGTGLWIVPIVMRVEDNAGNVFRSALTDYTFKIDPSGDKPKVAVIYPSPSETNRVMGGIIRIFGTSEDDDGVASVWMQIDVNNDGQYDAADVAGGTDWYNGGDGQLVGGTVSWNKSINTLGEFNPPTIPVSGISPGVRYKIVTLGGTDYVALGAANNNIGTEFTANTAVPSGAGTVDPLITRRINFRVRARDINTVPVDGSWSPSYVIDVDKNVPKIGSSVPLHMAQAATSTDRPYVSDMWVKGNWILGGSIEDESGISEIVITGSINGSLSGNPSWFVKGSDIGGGKYNYTLQVPVDTIADTSGSISFTIKTTDNNEPKLESTVTITVNYDNKAPVLNAYTGLTPVQQSNKTYTLASSVNEDGSGFSRVAFFFVRNVEVDANDRIYNPMVTKDGNANRTMLNATGTGWSIGMVDGLPRLQLTASVTRGGDEYSLSHAALVNNTNIRKGGLVKIGGLDRLITAVDSANGKITWADPVSTAVVTADVAYALVVDHLTTETPVWSGDTLASITNDDGDWLIESVTKSGGLYDWDASIDSRNIPDGPIEIHYVAYDQAGNYAAGTTLTSVQNNRPMLAAVTLGTDLDGNGTVSSLEKVPAFSALDGSGNKQAVATVASDAFTAKGLTSVDIDVVGGNGLLKYDFKVGTNTIHSLSNLRTAMEVAVSIDTGTDVLTAAAHGYTDGKMVYLDASVLPKETGSVDLPKGNYYVRDATTDTFKLAKTFAGTAIDFTSTGSSVRFMLLETIFVTQAQLEAASIMDGSRTFVFTIWDSTEELLIGSTSQHAILTVPLVVDAVDTVSPKSVISPFYWSSSLANSLFENSKSNGHIELGFTALGDADPKVSGKISIRGTVYDDQRLSSIWMSIDGFAFTGAGVTRATFDTNADGTAETLSRTYSQVATYSTALGSWTGTDQWTANGWKFTVTPDYFDQTGHKVNWQLDWDTSKITNVAALDRVIRILSEDKRTTPNASSEAPNATADITTNNVPSYQVDVVPYIRSISTPKRTTSGLKDVNIRSASGLFSVITGSDATFMAVAGFNLNPNAARIVTTAAVTGTVITATGNAIAYTGAASPYTSVNLSNSSAVSGYLELFTNGIRALNNVNNNDAKGDYTGTAATEMYNREPDMYVLKNATFNDDRYLRFFGIKNTGVKNGYYPEMVMEGDNPVFGFVNLTGGPNSPVGIAAGTGAGSYRPTNAMPQRAMFNGGTGVEMYTEYLIKGLIWDQMGMARDEGNRYIHASVYNYDGASMATVYDRYAELHPNGAKVWGEGVTYSDFNLPPAGNWSYSTNNNAISLESVNFENGLLLGRYQYPKLIAKGNSRTGDSRIYMLYYDDNTTNRNLIFRNFRIGTTAALGNQLFSGGVSSTGDAYAQYTNLVDSNTTGRLTAASNASKYFDFAVTSDYRIVIVYYDETDGRLKMRYSTNPVDGSAPTAAVAWTDSAVVFPDYVGNYVSMTVDSLDGIHIAAYDAGDSDLSYMYLPAYDSSQVAFRKVTVDAAFAVGNWTKIKVQEPAAGTIIPYIAYYNSSETGGRDSLKLAYCKTGITTLNVPEGVYASGLSAGFTTGNWEYMTVPAITPPQGGSLNFKQVNLDFDTTGRPVIGYLGTNLEFGSWLTE